MKTHSILISFSICLYYGVAIVDGTISPSDKGKKAKLQKELKVNSGPIDQNVIERNLIEDEPSVKDILVENAAFYKNTSARLFNGPVLVYVTPVRFIDKVQVVLMLFYGKLNHFSGTITATMWQKISVRNSIWFHQFGCKYFVADDICTNWVADMTSTAIGCLTCVRPVRKIKNVKISCSATQFVWKFLHIIFLDSLQSYHESFSIGSRKTTIPNYLRTRVNGEPLPIY